jgi:hypothetical protein
MDESAVVTAADNCPCELTIEVTGCTSNQADNDIGVGDGDFILDCIIDNDQLCLRAERQGTDQEDRIYTVTVDVTDTAGNTNTQSFEVDVPHDQSPPRDCVPDTINIKPHGNKGGKM